jgi:hypothetical protein
MLRQHRALEAVLQVRRGAAAQRQRLPLIVRLGLVRGLPAGVLRRTLLLRLLLLLLLWRRRRRRGRDVRHHEARPARLDARGGLAGGGGFADLAALAAAHVHERWVVAARTVGGPLCAAGVVVFALQGGLQRGGRGVCGRSEAW